MLKPRSYAVAVFLLLISLLANVAIVNTRVLASVSLFGQEEKATWERYTATGEEFSVLMPELPGVISSVTCLDNKCRKKRQEFIYAAYSEGGVYVVTSYDNPKRRQSIDTIINERLDNSRKAFDVVHQGDVKLNEFKGKKYFMTSKDGGYDRVVIFYLTSDHVYEVATVNETRDDASIQNFFGSFTLGERKGKDIGDGARTEAFTVPVNPVASSGKDVQEPKGNPTIRIFRPNELTRKAVIVLKASPEYTEKARQNQVTGTVTLQMIFDSSGRVANVRNISGLPYGLTEQAIKIARKIYFIPAVRDGKRVSQYIRVEYNFNIY